MKDYKYYVNGEFKDSSSGKCTTVYDPATGEAFASVPACTAQEALEAIEAAYIAQKSWKKLPSVARGAHVRALGEKIMQHKNELGELLRKEQAKPLAEAIGEVEGAAALTLYHSEWARRIEGEILPSDKSTENILIYKEPIGVAVCIVPWNFPVYVLLRKLAPALMAGCTVVIKPSSETPATALAIAELCDALTIPKGVINVITGSSAVIGKALAQSTKVGIISLTGSTVAGKEVMRQAAENVTKVSLELGGKAPAIVMNDADIDLAVECIAWARVKNAGQVCNAPERAYVQKDVEKTFIDKLVARMQKVTYGDTKAGYEMGALINKDAVLSVQAMVDKAVAQGAKVLCGGKAADMAGSFYMPTVLAECTQSMDIMHEEIFGPVLPVAIFETVDEVMKYANDSEVGLTSTLYTNDMNVALRFSNEIECGELYVNAAQGEAFQGFHSGWKKTGIGGDDGRHGFEEFLQTRTVYLNYKK